MPHQFPVPPPIYVGDAQAQETQINLIQETEQGITHTGIIDLQQLNTALIKPVANPDIVNANIISWVSVVGLKNVNVINELCLEHSIHPLVIEDILHTQQMPKIDVFDDYLYVVIRVPKTIAHKAAAEPEFNQVSLIIMKDRLLSFEEENDESFELIRKQFINYLPKLRKFKVDYIVYSLLDAVLDSYFSLTDRQSEIIEEFEDELIKHPENLSLIELYKLKRNVMHLRKGVQPMRDVVSVLSRQGTDYLAETTHVYFNDLYDHCLRISEQLDGYRDMLTSMLEIYRSSVNSKLNESMKTLTIIATVFMPLSFLTGVFGMNFKFMPGLEWHYGYYMALSSFVVIGVGMLIYFRKKKWM